MRARSERFHQKYLFKDIGSDGHLRATRRRASAKRRRDRRARLPASERAPTLVWSICSCESCSAMCVTHCGRAARRAAQSRSEDGHLRAATLEARLKQALSGGGQGALPWGPAPVAAAKDIIAWRRRQCRHLQGEQQVQANRVGDIDFERRACTHVEACTANRERHLA